MRRPVRVIAAATGLWIALACLDVSSPVSGIFSISNVLLPTPSVVEGDSSRDALGQVQPLRVVAFSRNGDTVRDAVVEFFAVDPTNKLRVNSVTRVAFGESLSPSAKVFAVVTPADGKGSVQTAVVLLPVVPTPVEVKKGDDTVFVFDPIVTDTLSAALLSPPLTVIVAPLPPWPIMRSPPQSC